MCRLVKARESNRKVAVLLFWAHVMDSVAQGGVGWSMFIKLSTRMCRGRCGASAGGRKESTYVINAPPNNLFFFFFVSFLGRYCACVIYSGDRFRVQ